VASPRSFRPSSVARILPSTWLAALRASALLAVLTSALRLGFAADQNPGAFQQTSMPVSAGVSRVIVIGFLGGFVRRDDPRHPEVRLVHELRQEYPTGVYADLFENARINEARQAILDRLKLNSERPVENRRQARILLFGHSWGASAVVRLSRKLDRDGIPVALTVLVDSVAKPFTGNGVIPPNVSEAANFYQTRGLIHGRSTITAADPTHTRIIGNFRRDYKSAPAPCHQFPWYSRLLTKGHIEIECDPDLWVEVKALLGRYLPSESAAQNPTDVLETEGRSYQIDLDQRKLRDRNCRHAQESRGHSSGSEWRARFRRVELAHRQNNVVIRTDGTVAPCFAMWSSTFDWGKIDQFRFEREQLCDMKKTCQKHCFATLNQNLAHYDVRVINGCGRT
jgi:pimeloyl-ACP methyl ester carboxylesterase